VDETKRRNLMSKRNNNYNYEGIEKRDPAEVLSEWDYDEKFVGSFDKERIFSDVINNKEDFEKILYEIVLWKVNRRIIVEKEEEIKKKLYSISENTPEKEATQSLIEDLVGKDNIGIGLPMASTIIHFFSRGQLPILDQRAYRVVYDKEPKYKGDIGELYWNYYQKCKDYYTEHQLKEKGIDFVEIDKYLYQVDKLNNNKNKSI
jgi:hypothetical protein